MTRPRGRELCAFVTANDDPDNPEPTACILRVGHRRLHRVRDRRELASVQETSNRPGRVEDLVGCPFCGAETYAYRWSRWGNGKRCAGCPAVLGGWLAYRVRDVAEKSSDEH